MNLQVFTETKIEDSGPRSLGYQK